MRLLILICILMTVGEVFTVHPPFPRRDDVFEPLPESQNVIPGQYLLKLSSDVVLKSDIQALKETIAAKYGLNVQKEVKIGDLSVLLVTGNKASVEAASALPQIAAFCPHFVQYIKKDVTSCKERASPYTWGLDRIDQRENFTGEALSGNTTYTYGMSDAGQGVTAYVVDTGIDVNHTEFEGRALWGFTADYMDGDADLNGHGTHVAGTIGSASYGVAKKVTLVAVKVLSGSGFGSTFTVIQGLKWILDDHMENFVTSGILPKSVINLSLGSPGYDLFLAAAVEEIIKNGATVVVAAGNANEYACLQTPANAPNVISVGASNVNDETTYFTNWGECVDIFAPGQDILSTFPHSLEPEGIYILSGTSMAAPHVAGVVARYQSTQLEARSPAQVADWLLSGATQDALDFLSSDQATSPNRLLFISCFPSDSGTSKVTGLTGLIFGMVLTWALF